MLLVTTGRKPCVNTRRFAKTLALLVPQAEYTVRGKKNIETLAEEARFKGAERVAIIGDRKGNPGRIEFALVNARSWKWLEKTIVIDKTIEPKEKIKQKTDHANATGPLAKQLIEFFAFDPEEDSPNEITMNENEMVFSKNNEIVLKIVFKVIDSA